MLQDGTIVDHYVIRNFPPDSKSWNQEAIAEMNDDFPVAKLLEFPSYFNSFEDSYGIVFRLDSDDVTIDVFCILIV